MNTKLLASVVALILPINASHAGDAEIKTKVDAWLGEGMKVEQIRKTDVSGLYELQSNGEVFYTDAEANHVFIGKLIEIKTGKDLTMESKKQLARINFADLPLDLAVKEVRGNGKRVLATFEDPNCGYCKRLAKETVGLTDVTIYTFLYPILSPESTAKAKTVWCSSDRAKTWNKWMLEGAAPASAECDASSIEKVLDLGQKLHVQGTPTLFLANGDRVQGVIPQAQLDRMLNEAVTQ